VWYCLFSMYSGLFDVDEMLMTNDTAGTDVADTDTAMCVTADSCNE